MKRKIRKRRQTNLKSLYTSEDWGRPVKESNGTEAHRPECRRDFARVIHSPSFRRLQGKTQLFPGGESDFFRNRLTHSLEVGQIAESIAFKLNSSGGFFEKNPINERVCFTAGLVHDMGHPPFGHNGEHALDDRMLEYGGFEGNAQTLRILTRLEKKRLHGGLGEAPIGDVDRRAGLNLTYRTLAAALKYDKVIDHVREPGESLVKGYYADDAQTVDTIKRAVDPDWESRGKPFKTLECTIMDVADDIAYSTYDLEDSLKAGFLTPADILSSDEDLLWRVANKVEKATNEKFEAGDVLAVFLELFSGIAEGSDEVDPVFSAIKALESSKKIASDGYLRTDLTAQIVGEFIAGVEVEVDEKFPSLSKAYINKNVLKRVETLKNYTYEATIFSTRLKVAEYRGYEVVAGIVDALSGPKGYLLMPDDTRKLYQQFESNATTRMRVICDFVAGMTDRYALEFYARLHSDSPQSIFKPT